MVEARGRGRVLFQIIVRDGHVERVWADTIHHDEDAAREWLAAWETLALDAYAKMQQPEDGSMMLPAGPVILHGWLAAYAFDGNRFRQIA